MAKESVKIKNAKRAKMAKLQAPKRKALKAALKNTDLSFEERLDAQQKLSELPRNGAKDRYRNRCALTGRPRGNLRHFKMSRIMLRELASWGQVPGLIKSSW
jgi:small subunit ribosomal protein S14